MSSDSPIVGPAQLMGQAVPEALELLNEMDADNVLPESEVELHCSMTEQLSLSGYPASQMLTTVYDTDLEEDHPDVDLPGVVLEDYLGGGGQGWVYLGKVRETGKIVAVKIIRRDSASARAAAAREAELCSRVRHPNLLRIFRSQPAGRFWVVIMELIRGQELGRVELSSEELRRCCRHLADALIALHTQDIVHCDVKPANILLRARDKAPVLVDFGLAQDLKNPQPTKGISGTPYFMAPESFRSESAHPAWDAYSLGVTTSILLVGKVDRFSSLNSLHSAKLSGYFDSVLQDALGKLDPNDIRGWCRELLAGEPEQRLNALRSA